MNGNSVLRIISSKRLGGLAAGLAFLLITACTPPVGTQPAAQDDPTPEAASPLADTIWKLVFFGEPDAETPVIEGSSITLSFDAEGRAGGSGGLQRLRRRI